MSATGGGLVSDVFGPSLLGDVWVEMELDVRFVVVVLVAAVDAGPENWPVDGSSDVDESSSSWSSPKESFPLLTTFRFFFCFRVVGASELDISAGGVWLFHTC